MTRHCSSHIARARRHAGAVVGAAMAVLLSAVPSTGANREHQQLMADIRMLQEQSQQLQLMLASITEALKTVTGRIDQQSETARKTAADQRLQMDSLGSAIGVLREKLDETNVRLSSMTQEVEALRLSIPTMPPPAPTGTAELPIGPTGDPSAPQPVQPTPAPAPAVNAAAGMSPQRLYSTAYADYASGQWSLAVQGFDAFVRTFPKSEQADDAQFYIGEANVLDGKPEDAVAAYDKVIANYPDGDRVPFALYKRGLVLEGLGQTDRARESYETAIKRFPDNEASVLAKQRLDRLPRPGR